MHIKRKRGGGWWAFMPAGVSPPSCVMCTLHPRTHSTTQHIHTHTTARARTHTHTHAHTHTHTRTYTHTSPNSCLLACSPFFLHPPHEGDGTCVLLRAHRCCLPAIFCLGVAEKGTPKFLHSALSTRTHICCLYAQTTRRRRPHNRELRHCQTLFVVVSTLTTLCAPPYICRGRAAAGF